MYAQPGTQPWPFPPGTTDQRIYAQPGTPPGTNVNGQQMQQMSNGQQMQQMNNGQQMQGYDQPASFNPQLAQTAGQQFDPQLLPPATPTKYAEEGAANLSMREQACEIDALIESLLAQQMSDVQQALLNSQKQILQVAANAAEVRRVEARMGQLAGTNQDLQLSVYGSNGSPQHHLPNTLREWNNSLRQIIQPVPGQVIRRVLSPAPLENGPQYGQQYNNLPQGGPQYNNMQGSPQPPQTNLPRNMEVQPKPPSDMPWSMPEPIKESSNNHHPVKNHHDHAHAGEHEEHPHHSKQAATCRKSIAQKADTYVEEDERGGTQVERIIIKATAESVKSGGAASPFMCMALDVGPAIVILLNALEIGLSNDIDPEHDVWDVCEKVWIVCYTVEFTLKLYLFGPKEMFCGEAQAWNFFDGGCLAMSYLEMVMKYIFEATAPGGGAVGIMKMLRLCRLARLIRALHYEILDELKQMIAGVLDGMKVLCWAIVLLFFTMFFIGVAMRTLIGDNEPEFSTVPKAMMTSFRCFTDGCSAYDGTPLQERLFEDYGGLFGISYVLSFMFIQVGVFNLIMAVFIENVVNNGESRRLEELGRTSAHILERIREVLCILISQEPGSKHIIIDADFLTGRAKTDDLLDDEFVVTRDMFSSWLSEPLLLRLFREAGIEVATKAELFDVLDVDMGGELNVTELTSGLMRLRGPVTKADIVAVGLKVRYLTAMVQDQGELLDKMDDDDEDEK